MNQLLLAAPSIPIAAVIALYMAGYYAVATGRERKIEWSIVVACGSVPAFSMAEFTAKWLSRLVPLKYDQFAYWIDEWFGEPSFFLGRIVYHNAALKDAVSVTYGLLPAAVVAVLLGYIWQRSEAEMLFVLKTFLVCLLAAVPIYLIFPICGPQFAFPRFPDVAPQHLTPHFMVLTAAPNGMPSVHAATAMLVLWFAWPWRRARAPASLFLALTLFAILGSGQHYAIDAIAAIPYAIFAYWTSHSLFTQIQVSEADQAKHRPVQPFAQ